MVVVVYPYLNNNQWYSQKRHLKKYIVLLGFVTRVCCNWLLSTMDGFKIVGSSKMNINKWLKLSENLPLQHLHASNWVLNLSRSDCNLEVIIDVYKLDYVEIKLRQIGTFSVELCIKVDNSWNCMVNSWNFELWLRLCNSVYNKTDNLPLVALKS